MSWLDLDPIHVEIAPYVFYVVASSVACQEINK